MKFSTSKFQRNMQSQTYILKIVLDVKYQNIFHRYLEENFRIEGRAKENSSIGLGINQSINLAVRWWVGLLRDWIEMTQSIEQTQFRHCRQGFLWFKLIV